MALVVQEDATRNNDRVRQCAPFLCTEKGGPADTSAVDSPDVHTGLWRCSSSVTFVYNNSCCGLFKWIIISHLTPPLPQVASQIRLLAGEGPVHELEPLKTVSMSEAEYAAWLGPERESVLSWRPIWRLAWTAAVYTHAFVETNQ